MHTEGVAENLMNVEVYESIISDSTGADIYCKNSHYTVNQKTVDNAKHIDREEGCTKDVVP